MAHFTDQYAIAGKSKVALTVADPATGELRKLTLKGESDLTPASVVALIRAQSAELGVGSSTVKTAIGTEGSGTCSRKLVPAGLADCLARIWHLDGQQSAPRPEVAAALAAAGNGKGK